MAKRKSYLNEFLRLKKVNGIYAKDRSKGFRYLHNTITKRLAEGKEFKLGDLDFSKLQKMSLVNIFGIMNCILSRWLWKVPHCSIK